MEGEKAVRGKRFVGAEPIVLNCLVVAKLAGLLLLYSGVRCARLFVSHDGMSPLAAEPASLPPSTFTSFLSPN